MRRSLTDCEWAMIDKSGWPLRLLQDPSRQPRYAHTLSEFKREVLVGDHLEDIVVLPGGLESLGLDEASTLPNWLTDTLDKSPTVLDFLCQLDRCNLKTHKAALEYVDDEGRQREALPRPYPYCLWDDPSSSDDSSVVQKIRTPSLPEAWRNLRHRRSAAEALVRRGEADPAKFYLCELRRLRECENTSTNTTTKSISRRHARDVLGDVSKWTLYWNCYDDGIFIGGFGSGKGLHVDQVLWSNIGKQWRGYKLLAVWPAGRVSAEVVDSLNDAHFHPPLGAAHLAALERAVKIAFLRPGDIFVCSGGVAHATLCVSEGLSVTGYESLVTLGARHVGQFLKTGNNTGPASMDRGIMEQDDLQDLQAGVIRRFLRLLTQAIAETDHESSRFLGGCLGVKACNAQLLGDVRQCLADVGRQILAHPRFAAQVPVAQVSFAVERICHGTAEHDGHLAKRRRITCK